MAHGREPPHRLPACSGSARSSGSTVKASEGTAAMRAREHQPWKADAREAVREHIPRQGDGKYVAFSQFTRDETEEGKGRHGFVNKAYTVATHKVLVKHKVDKAEVKRFMTT